MHPALVPTALVLFFSASAQGCGLFVGLASGAADDVIRANERARRDERVMLAYELDPRTVDELGVRLTSNEVPGLEPLSEIVSDASPVCSSSVTQSPAFEITLTAPAPATFRMVIERPTRDVSGILVDGPGGIRQGCLEAGLIATPIGAPWKAGVYRVYMTTPDLPYSHTVVGLALIDGGKPAPWRRTARTVEIAATLERALYVEVPLQPGRTTRQDDQGTPCAGAGAPPAPDLRVVVATPARGLVIRPLHRGASSRVWAQFDASGYAIPATPSCVMSTATEPLRRAGYYPSYRDLQEIEVPDGFVGEVGVSFGSLVASDQSKVTVMVTSAATMYDPTHLQPLALEGPLELADRKVGRSFPELDVRQILGVSGDTLDDSMGLTATLFATAPDGIFVYPRRDLPMGPIAPEVLGRTPLPFVGTGVVPADEPLLAVITSASDELVLVTADGLAVRANVADLALTPQRKARPVTAPRPFVVAFDALPRFASEDGKSLIARHKEAEARWTECVDRVEEHFDELIQRETTEVTGRGGTVYVTGPEVRRLEAEIEPSKDRTCGSAESRLAEEENTTKRVIELLTARRAELMKPAVMRLGP